MDTVLYIGLSVLDAYATLALIYLSFRWPFWRDFDRLTVIVVVISVVSYVDRMVLDIEAWDPAIQLLLYILSLRYFLRVNWFYAWPLAVFGYVLFLLVQFSTYTALYATGVVSAGDAAASAGAGTYIIQAANDVICYAVCVAMYVFNHGFTHVDIPPHDDYLPVRQTRGDVVVNIAGSLAIATFMYWILNYHGHIAIVLPSLAASIVAMAYLARRKEIR
ncbi:hypothetical protein [Paenibacillus elgii]|uniref:hypothetical protein n=1 Tax=Paenibacillus elgii TaxID=189691 RepID=UPI000248DEDD|nr:hypothetical protein [Paenibacillus elgii]